MKILRLFLLIPLLSLNAFATMTAPSPECLDPGQIDHLQRTKKLLVGCSSGYEKHAHDDALWTTLDISHKTATIRKDIWLFPELLGSSGRAPSLYGQLEVIFNEDCCITFPTSTSKREDWEKINLQIELFQGLLQENGVYIAQSCRSFTDEYLASLNARGFKILDLREVLNFLNKTPHVFGSPRLDQYKELSPEVIDQIHFAQMVLNAQIKNLPMDDFTSQDPELTRRVVDYYWAQLLGEGESDAATSRIVELGSFMHVSRQLIIAQKVAAE